MKSILIDELFKDSNTQTSATVSINGKDYTGYTIAKPLNYEKDHLSIITRIKMALEIIKGNAIAVAYFSDIPKQDQIKYVQSEV